MAVGRLKTWIANEILTASDLNAEFNNILNNGEDLGWPATKAKDLDAQQLILDGDQDTHITADTDDQIDFAVAGFDGFRVDGTTASPVNGFDATMQATGVAPEFKSRGEANIGIEFQDSNNNEALILGSTASAVNEVTIANAATSNDPTISATGDDTNIGVNFVTKGSGTAQVGGDQIATLGATNTFTAAQTITSTDAGTGIGPELDLFRNSASPAANDGLARIRFSGKNSAGSTVFGYARIRAVIIDETDGTEDGRLQLETTIAGSPDARLIIENGIYTTNATGGDQGADTINASAIYDDGVQVLPQDLQTEQATTSGTAFNFTGIHSAARRITVMFDAVSLSGTDHFLIQIGDSGGLETSGYVSNGHQLNNAGGSAGVTSTSGYVIYLAIAAGSVSGHVTLTLQDAANTWVSSHMMRDDASNISMGAGTKSLSATLTQVTLTRTGTDTFDAGSVNILVE